MVFNNERRLSILMKKIYLSLYILLGTLDLSAKVEVTPDHSQLLTLLELINGKSIFRAPTPPSNVTTPIGALIFQGYNSGTTTPYTQGANITAYYGLNTLPTAGRTMPANIIMSTVPSVNTAPIARIVVRRDGKIGIGQFNPGDANQPNAALNVEGDASTGAGTAMHVGPRTASLISFTSSTLYSGQVDGNLYAAQNTQTPLLTSYGQFDPYNFTPLRQITAPIVINDFPYTITAPGKYYVYNKTTYTPAGASTTPAITINASNVILDLQGFVLSQATGTVNSIDGIQITSGQTDVTIRNGTISGFQAHGIEALGNHNRLLFKDLTVTGCAFTGIGITAGTSNNVSIKNCLINNCLTSASVAAAVAAGVLLNSINNVTIDNLKISNTGLLATANSASGLRLNSVNSGYITNSIVENSRVGFGFDTNSSIGIIYDNCLAVNNTGNTNQLAYSLSGAASTYCQYINCISSSNKATSGARGFDASTLATLQGCTVEGTTLTGAVGTSLIGVNLDNKSVAANTIVAASRSNEANATGQAFTSTAASNTVFSQCIAINNFSGSTATRGFVAPAATPNFIIKQCYSRGHFNNYSTTPTTIIAIQNLSTNSVSTHFNGFPVGSNQTQPNISTLTTFATDNRWLNTGVN